MTETAEGTGDVETIALEALNKITVLKYNSAKNPKSKEQEIHLVGTAHISKKSCEVVRHVIQNVKPEVLKFSNGDLLKCAAGSFLGALQCTNTNSKTTKKRQSDCW